MPIGLTSDALRAVAEDEALLDLASGGTFTAACFAGREASQLMSGGLRGQRQARRRDGKG